MQNSIWIYDLMRTNNKKRKQKQTNKNLKLKKIKILYQIIRKIFLKKTPKNLVYWQKRVYILTKKKERNTPQYLLLYLHDKINKG